MPLFSGRHSSKIDFCRPPVAAYFWNQVDQPAPMERMQDGCKRGAFLEVHLLASRKDGRDLGRSRFVWT
jgi:hypothetical protein